MHVLSATALQLILLSVLGESGSFVIRRRPYSGVINAGFDSSQSSNNIHNATVNCGDPSARRKTILHCMGDMLQISNNGYPWARYRSHGNSRNIQNITDRRNTLGDALDSLDHMCHIQDRSQSCLEKSGIRDYCLASNMFSFLHKEFQFICHQRRDENLVHSLQCLHDKRVMAMLYFHIADRCRGMGTLDDIFRRYKKEYFFWMDIKPIKQAGSIPQMYCFPKPVISTCIRDIVEDQCGSTTADFVKNYMLYIQDWFGQALDSAGLDSSNICDQNDTSDISPSKSPIPSAYTKLSMTRLLETGAPGTALDTVYGKNIQVYLQSLSAEELCTTDNAYIAYTACLMFSDDKSEKPKFNILQFAQQITPLIYWSQCSRLQEFTACWNLLQEICGPKVRGLEHDATLLVEGCKIQSEMDTVGCHWQDMLLPHYIQASRVTVWPTVDQCSGNLMSLEDVHYGTVNSVMDDLDTVISLLQRGVEEISRKCGSQPAKRLRLLLMKLRYLQPDAWKYMIFLLNGLHAAVN